MKKYILGNVRKIIFQSTTSPYKVGIFKVRETNDSSLEEYVNKIIGFTGSFSEINDDVDYIFYGDIINHPKYGVQFSVENYEVREPNDSESLILYLSSGMFKGIGLKTAKKIVERFGEDTVNVIKNEYNKLAFVSGMTELKAKRMHDKIMDTQTNQDMIIKLNSYGFSVKEAINLLSIYNNDLINIVENNIYDLVEYISFEKLDLLFLKTHSENDSLRIEAIIKHVIYNMCFESGDTLINKEELFLNMKNYFKSFISGDTFLSYLDSLKEKKQIIEHCGFIELIEFYDSEKNIINGINKLKSIKTVIDEEQINDRIKEYERRNAICFNKDQINAITGSIKNNFYIITGGPGTGKTTIIKAIVEILKDTYENYQDSDITLLAPTGRSAKRMMETVFVPAYTIHKFLKWNKENGTFQINEDNKSKTKVVIVDESSMIDIFLFSSLLKGLSDRVKLILVGDANQLPSIGPGDILNNLLSKEYIDKTYLNEIYRVKNGSYITYLANDIKNQKEYDYFDENYDDFKFISSSDNNIKDYLIEICKQALNKKINCDNFQVLAPMYKGINGIDNINKIMQDIFNKDSRGYIINDKEYREGDKVIQLVNDVDNNIYNGDIGYIKSIDYISKKIIITIDYMGNCVEYKSGEFDKFTLAYAISIHKSQGSEYDNVVVVLSRNASRMFYNKLIYTAVTRAKKSLIILGEIESYNKSVKTLYASNRNTYLKYV